MKGKHLVAIPFLFYTAKNQKLLKPTLFLVVNNSLSTRVIKRVSSASGKQKHENFYKCASLWYVEDSKIDFKNENTARGNRLY